MSPVARSQRDRWREVAGLVILAFTIFLFLALITDGYQGEPRRSMSVEAASSVPNQLGMGGALTAGALSVLLGPAAHVLYVLTCIWGIMLLRHKPLDRFPLRMLGMVLLAGAVAGLLHADLLGHTENPTPGGALGAFVGEPLVKYFGVPGANVIAITMAIIGILLSTEFLFLQVFQVLRYMGGGFWSGTVAGTQWCSEQLAAYRAYERKRKQPFRKVADRILSEPEESESPVELENVKETAPAMAEALPAEAEVAVPPQGVGADADWVEPPVDDLSRIKVRTSMGGKSGDSMVAGPVAQPELPFAVSGMGVGLVRDSGDFPEVSGPVASGRAMGNSGPVSSMPTQIGVDSVILPPISAPAAPEDDDDTYTPFHILADVAEIDEDLAVMAEANAALSSANSVNMDADEDDMDDDDPLTPASSAPLPTILDSTNNAPAASRKPVFRCKSSAMEVLPPDYEYPKHFTLPPVELFEPPPARINTDLSDQLRQTSVRLEETFKTFGIEARVTEVVRGPTITRFELQPAPGIKVSRFHSLADDIALALKAQGIRVEAPIPGKGRVGIEVPNKKREPVVIRDLFETDAFRKCPDRLKLALGKDVAGDPITADLTKMPHLLVAGATGSGKTVCVKTFLASLLYVNTPDELQLILIDPKMVELSIFNDIPHLITPVVIDPKKASSALNWLINEMEERYRLFAHLRVRNIDVYNDRVENGEIEMVNPSGEKGEAVTVNRKLPYIVCVIDELADLMMLARAEVEGAIARLAQLARATGIHLIIATQRPSVDVLTGVIKANFPARLSFQVSSRVDSRCILDEIGAERLIGMGDMLYLPAGRSKPQRIQGAFVGDNEMEALIAYLKTQAPPQYRDEIERFGQNTEPQADLLEEGDDLFDDAVRVVLETGQASISMVQRRLRVGYTRAARLIDMMELKGIVGPHTGSKAREILVGMPRKTDEVA